MPHRTNTKHHPTNMQPSKRPSVATQPALHALPPDVKHVDVTPSNHARAMSRRESDISESETMSPEYMAAKARIGASTSLPAGTPFGASPTVTSPKEALTSRSPLHSHVSPPGPIPGADNGRPPASAAGALPAHRPLPPIPGQVSPMSPPPVSATGPLPAPHNLGGIQTNVVTASGHMPALMVSPRLVAHPVITAAASRTHSSGGSAESLEAVAPGMSPRHAALGRASRSPLVTQTTLAWVFLTSFAAAALTAAIASSLAGFPSQSCTSLMHDWFKVHAYINYAAFACSLASLAWMWTRAQREHALRSDDESATIAPAMKRHRQGVTHRRLLASGMPAPTYPALLGFIAHAFSLSVGTGFFIALQPEMMGYGQNSCPDRAYEYAQGIVIGSWLTTAYFLALLAYSYLACNPALAQNAVEDASEMRLLKPRVAPARSDSGVGAPVASGVGSSSYGQGAPSIAYGRGQPIPNSQFTFSDEAEGGHDDTRSHARGQGEGVLGRIKGWMAGPRRSDSSSVHNPHRIMSPQPAGGPNIPPSPIVHAPSAGQGARDMTSPSNVVMTLQPAGTAVET